MPPEVAKQFAGWIQYIKKNGAAYITFAPRGVGYSALTDDKKHLTQTRRRFMLLGHALDAMGAQVVAQLLKLPRALDLPGAAAVAAEGARATSGGK